MDVFVYGTLADPDRAAAVLGSTPRFVDEATLYGLHRVEGRYPTLAPGGSVTGRVLRTDDVAALDRYEGVDDGLYVRVTIADDPPTACYVGRPDRLGLDDEIDWPGEGPFEPRVRRYCERDDIRLERR